MQTTAGAIPNQAAYASGEQRGDSNPDQTARQEGLGFAGTFVRPDRMHLAKFMDEMKVKRQLTDTETISNRARAWALQYSVDHNSPIYTVLSILSGLLAQFDLQVKSLNSAMHLKADAAVSSWEEMQKRRVEVLGEQLEKKPQIVVNDLRQCKHGCLWMIERWSFLLRAYERRGSWSDAEFVRANNLLGVMIVEREPGDTPIDAILKQGAEKLREFITSQIQSLHQRIYPKLDNEDRNARRDAIQGMFSHHDAPLHRQFYGLMSKTQNGLHWAWKVLAAGEEQLVADLKQAVESNSAVANSLLAGNPVELMKQSMAEHDESLRQTAAKHADPADIDDERCDESELLKAECDEVLDDDFDPAKLLNDKTLNFTELERFVIDMPPSILDNVSRETFGDANVVDHPEPKTAAIDESTGTGTSGRVRRADLPTTLPVVMHSGNRRQRRKAAALVRAATKK